MPSIRFALFFFGATSVVEALSDSGAATPNRLT